MLIDINENYQKNIFCYLNGKHHFEMFYQIFKQNKDINFFIYSPNLNLDDFVQSKLYYLTNVTLIKNNENEIKELIYKIKSFGLMITTDAQATSAHQKSLQFVNFFQKNNIKVFELQHGLFQLGLHYTSIPHKDCINSDCLYSPSYADYVLSYYPTSLSNEITIGYPLYIKENNQYIQGEYTLILSNLHWNAYTDSQKNLFYTAVIQLIKNNPDRLFIWKMHHGETKQLDKIKEILKLWGEMKKNIIFTSDENLFKYISTSDLIKNSQKVISTISTVLLECEMYNKPTIVYETQSVKCLIDKLKSKTTFKNYQELETSFKTNNLPFSTGCLQRYDNVTLRKAIDKYYKTSNSTDLLNNILEFSASVIF